MFGFNRSVDIGIDLGTANVLIYCKGKGIVLREPSVAAVDKGTGTVKGVGIEAQRMLGRTPGNIIAVRPLRNGVISDDMVTLKMLQMFILKWRGRKSLKNARVMVCVPSGATDVEQRAVKKVAYDLGAKEVFVIEEPRAAAIGAGIDVSRPRGSMIVDIGGGTTDTAVISYGGIAANESIKTGGRHIDGAIADYIAAQYGVRIGEKTAEEIKLSLGAALIGGMERRQFKGRSLKTGLPECVALTGGEVSHAIAPTVRRIVDSVRRTLSETPPELAADLIDTGIVLTGGGAKLKGLDKLISHETGLKVSIAEDPMYCVALGALKLGSGEDMDAPRYA